MTKNTNYSLLGAVLYWVAMSPLAHANPAAIPSPPVFNKSDTSGYGNAVANYLDLLDTGWVDSYAKSSITIMNARGEKTVSKTVQLTREGKGGNKALVRYMSPANVRGVAALTHEHHAATDDSWLYLPSSRRVRRISGANRTSSFQGTEFTYEDITQVVPSRYQWKYLGRKTISGVSLAHLEAKPTYKNTGYSKLHFFVNDKLWRVEKVEFFDKGGRLLKVLEYSKWKFFHERYWRARRLEMKNVQTQKVSTIDIGAQFVNLQLYKKKDGSARNSLGEEMFTRRALQSN